MRAMTRFGEDLLKQKQLRLQQSKPALMERGIGDLQAQFDQTQNEFGEALQNFDPFMQQGGQAFDLQSAYSGASGPEAQAQAFANFQSSPQQAFLQSQGEEAIRRNAAATGELGGAKTQQALMQYGQGLASQDFQQQFQNLGGLSQMGLGATGTVGQMTSNLGNLRSSLGNNIAGFYNTRLGGGKGQSNTMHGGDYLAAGAGLMGGFASGGFFK